MTMVSLMLLGCSIAMCIYYTLMMELVENARVVSRFVHVNLHLTMVVL